MTPDNVKAFEEDFKRACLTHKVTAIFVIARDDGEKGSMLSIGGVTELSDYVERCLAAFSTEAKQKRH